MRAVTRLSTLSLKTSPKRQTSKASMKMRADLKLTFQQQQRVSKLSNKNHLCNNNSSNKSRLYNSNNSSNKSHLCNNNNAKDGAQREVTRVEAVPAKKWKSTANKLKIRSRQFCNTTSSKKRQRNWSQLVKLPYHHSHFLSHFLLRCPPQSH